MGPDPQAISAALLGAADTGVPVAPFGAAGDVDDAYAAQSYSVRKWLADGRRIVGRKIGLTNPRVQAQLGVDQPDFGALFDDMRFASGAVVPQGTVLQPRIEAEMAFVLARDVRSEDDVAVLDGAVAEVLPALEIVGSRIADWKITIFDTIADNASSGAFVLGMAGVALADVDLTGAAMRMERTRSGVTEVVSEGRGADCLGSPLVAARWLAGELLRRGDPLRAGDVVLTGALGPMVPVEPGDHYEAVIDGLGAVAVSFA